MGWEGEEGQVGWGPRYGRGVCRDCGRASGGAGAGRRSGASALELESGETEGGATGEVGPRKEVEDLVGTVADEMEAGNGSIPLEMRYRLACKAFDHTAAYDSAIARYLADTTVEAVSQAYRMASD